ncbi:MAG: hypothetical protein ACXVLX_09925, partial [Ilumatobacteraceae bacterium]
MFVALVAFWSAAPSRAHAATTTTDPTTTTSAPTTTTLDPNGSSSPTITIPTHSAVDPIDKPVVVDAPSGGSNGSGTIVINTPTGTSNAVLLVLLVTLVAILPGLLLLTTTFPRF